MSTQRVYPTKGITLIGNPNKLKNNIDKFCAIWSLIETAGINNIRISNTLWSHFPQIFCQWSSRQLRKAVPVLAILAPCAKTLKHKNKHFINMYILFTYNTLCIIFLVYKYFQRMIILHCFIQNIKTYWTRIIWHNSLSSMPTKLLINLSKSKMADYRIFNYRYIKYSFAYWKFINFMKKVIKVVTCPKTYN